MAYIARNKNGQTVTQAPVQQFTAEQSAAVNAQWKAFNERQSAIANASGLPVESRSQQWALNQNALFMGNAFPVPKDAWGQWARDFIDVQRNQLGIFADIASTNSRSVPLSVLVDHFGVISNVGDDVNVSLDGRSSAKGDSPIVDYNGTPIAVFDNTMTFGWRQMLQMQSAGSNMQMVAQNAKRRRLLESLEDMVLNGRSDIVVGGMPIYGLLNHPNRGTTTHGLTLATATPAEAKAAVVALLKVLHGKNFRSGVTLYMNWDDYFAWSSYDYQMGTGALVGVETRRVSIEMEILNLAGIDRIVATDSVPANTLIGLVKQREVVEMLNGMPATTRALTRQNPEDDYVFKNIAVQSLQLKYDAQDQMGLAVSTQS